MLELYILKQYPSLNLLPFGIGECCLFNHIKKRDRFFWLLRSFKFLILFKDGIASLDFSLMRFYLVLWERNASDLVKNF